MGSCISKCYNTLFATVDTTRQLHQEILKRHTKSYTKNCVELFSRDMHWIYLHKILTHSSLIDVYDRFFHNLLSIRWAPQALRSKD